MLSLFSRKKKPEKARTSQKSNSRSTKPQLNSFGLPVTQNDDEDEELEAELRAISGVQQVLSSSKNVKGSDDDDSDLEAELSQLIGGSKKKKGLGKKSADASSKTPILPIGDIIKQVKDLNVEDGDDNELDDIDESDPDLLNELLELTKSDEEEILSDEEEEVEEEPTLMMVLQSRLDMYKLAESKAIKSKETSRARRFGRGIKTLQELIKKVELGQPVLESDIPPPIATNLKPNITENTGQQTSNVEVNSTLINPESSTKAIKGGEKENLSMGTNAAAESKKTETLKDISQRESELLNIDTKPDVEERTKSQAELPTPSVSKTQIKVNAESKDELVKIKTPLQNIEYENEVESKPKGIIDKSGENQQSVASSSSSSNNVALVEQKQNKIDNMLTEILRVRREEYKANAIKAKRENQLQEAVGYLKNVKILNALLSAAENGEIIDKSMIPPSLSETTSNKSPENSPILETPKTVLEALNQRLGIYSDLTSKAERDGNLALTEQYAKRVKVYNDAIKLHKMGKNVPYEKLPTPPGCPPIPVAFQVP